MDIITKCGLVSSTIVLSTTLVLAAVSAKLTPATGPPTTSVAIAGTGFPASVAVDVYFDTTDEALAATSATGAFTISISVPTSAVPGTHWITAVARGTAGTAAQASFDVQTFWPEFHRTSTHAGNNPFENVLSLSTVGSLNLDWIFTTGGGIISSPVVDGGVVYFGSEDHNVYAVNATTGTQVWKFATAGEIVFSHAGTALGNVYIGSEDANLYAIKASTGAKVWSYTTPYAVFSGPTILNNVVYFAAGLNVYALNATTGALIWKFAISNDGFINSPAVANGTVYIGAEDSNLYALNATTGAMLWKFATGGSIDSPPTVANGVVYVGSTDNSVYAVNARTGVQVWRYATGDEVESSPAVANGVVYVGSDDDNIYAINSETHTVEWSYNTGGAVYSSPVVANGVVYVGSANGNLYAFNAQNGTSLWVGTTGGTVGASPVVVNGAVYETDYDGNLYTFDLSAVGLEKVKPPLRPEPASLQPDWGLTL